MKTVLCLLHNGNLSFFNIEFLDIEEKQTCIICLVFFFISIEFFLSLVCKE